MTSSSHTSPLSTLPVTGATLHRPPANLVRYPALDGLRAIAFLMVAWGHYCHVPWCFGGVNFFFVLSGFLITGILFDTRDRPGRARSFYLRRTLRIFPLYYGVMLALLLTYGLFHWQWSWPWLAWPLYLGNFLRLWAPHTTQEPQLCITYAWLHAGRSHLELFFGHFWSLCVEEQFYMLWPWLVFGLRSRRRLMALCLAAVILCPLARALVGHFGPPWLQQREFTYTVGVPFQLDALLLGALLAFLWRGSHRERLQRWALVVLCCCGAVTVLFLLRHGLFLHLNSRTDYRYPRGHLSWGLSFLDLFGASLLITALRPGTVVYSLLNTRPLRNLGRISYGAYVFHDVFHLALMSLANRIINHIHLLSLCREFLTLVLALILTFTLASLSFRFFETPFLELKERWAPSAPTAG